GTTKWEHTLPASGGIPSIGSDGTIYVNVIGVGLQALSSGQLKWTAGDGSPGALELAIAADGTIYSTLFHSSTQSSFTAVNPDGSIRWILGVPSEGGSPAIGSDGTIYVTGGCMPGVLTAVYGSSPLASSSWPRGRCGNRNTGCYGEY
ncbi:MAG: PQQ-like beta-propeller repeat protein, partial [candidate division Zixibacteria bacterium]|nr:PQQ-like beta-propeller repeat protein [candidate division Zixibacteria bacterium]